MREVSPAVLSVTPCKKKLRWMGTACFLRPAFPTGGFRDENGWAVARLVHAFLGRMTARAFAEGWKHPLKTPGIAQVSSGFIDFVRCTSQEEFTLKSGVTLEEGDGLFVLTRAAGTSEEFFTRGTEFVPER